MNNFFIFLFTLFYLQYLFDDLTFYPYRRNKGIFCLLIIWCNHSRLLYMLQIFVSDRNVTIKQYVLCCCRSYTHCCYSKDTLKATDEKMPSSWKALVFFFSHIMNSSEKHTYYPSRLVRKVAIQFIRYKWFIRS